MAITSVGFRDFKALRNYSVALQRMNVFVGPNNSGKSTILSAFRVLEQALRRARARSAPRVMTHTGRMSWGHKIPVNTIPISLENVHSDYADSDSSIEVRYSHGNKIYLLFPADGGVTMYRETTGKLPTTSGAFRKAFPDIVQTIPVLGPVEHDEPIVNDATVRRAAGTPVASRHFRNYWWKNPEGFERFQRLVESTWPGMTIRKPERPEVLNNRLTMFVSENRIPRELYWSGLGFQIWCQLLTHISRCSESDMLIVDEPEVYLHPEVQRQLLWILRGVRPDIVLATHSVEILGEADLFHRRKEVENYLLSPAILDRAAKKAVGERERRTGESRSADIDMVSTLESITDALKAEYSGQYIDKRRGRTFTVPLLASSSLPGAGVVRTPASAPSSH